MQSAVAASAYAVFLARSACGSGRSLALVRSPVRRHEAFFFFSPLSLLYTPRSSLPPAARRSLLPARSAYFSCGAANIRWPPPASRDARRNTSTRSTRARHRHRRRRGGGGAVAGAAVAAAAAARWRRGGGGSHDTKRQDAATFCFVAAARCRGPRSICVTSRCARRIQSECCVPRRLPQIKIDGLWSHNRAGGERRASTTKYDAV